MKSISRGELQNHMCHLFRYFAFYIFIRKVPYFLSKCWIWCMEMYFYVCWMAEHMNISLHGNTMALNQICEQYLYLISIFMICYENILFSFGFISALLEQQFFKILLKAAGGLKVVSGDTASLPAVPDIRDFLWIHSLNFEECGCYKSPLPLCSHMTVWNIWQIQGKWLSE